MHIAESNNRIKSLLLSEKASLCSRMGVVESQITKSMINDFDSLDFKLRKAAWVNAGIYPPTRHELSKFAGVYKDCLRNTDLIAVWPAGIQKPHDDLLGYFCKGIPTVGMNVLDIFSCSTEMDIDDIWISMFENKKILIIHPFARSFSVQFSKLKSLHKVPILPEFNAVFSAPPMTQGINLARISYSSSLAEYLDGLDKLISSLGIDFALLAASA